MKGKLPLYLAGKMSGVPQFNIPLFERAAQELRALGYDIVSPVELDSDEVRRECLASPDGSWNVGRLGGETWGDILARDIKVVADGIGGIVFLPDWYESRGARLEAFVALLTGKTSYYNYRAGDHPQPIPATMVRQIIKGNMP